MRYHRSLLAFGLVSMMSGCSGGPTFAEVEGYVKKNGKPLDNIQVEFWPEGNGPKSTGVTDAEGKYVLNSVDSKRKGAMIGKHVVILQDLKVRGDKFLGRAAENHDFSKYPKTRIPLIYNNVTSTRLKKEVVAGQSNVIELTVE